MSCYSITELLAANAAISLPVSRVVRRDSRTHVRERRGLTVFTPQKLIRFSLASGIFSKDCTLKHFLIRGGSIFEYPSSLSQSQNIKQVLNVECF